MCPSPASTSTSTSPPWESHDKTAVFTEFSKETEGGDIPYYPKRLGGDLTLLGRYRKLAEELQGVSFLGRLATYRYMDMHHVIGEALEFSQRYLRWKSDPSQTRPLFANDEG